MNNTGNNFDFFASQLKGVQPIIPVNTKPTNTNVNQINKDNIFDPSALQQFFPKLSVEQPTSQSQNNPQDNKPYNAQETQKLNTLLSTLGFKIGDDTASQFQNESKEPLQLIARAKEGIYFVNEQENNYLGDTSKQVFADCSVSIFNNNGSLIGFANQNGIGVYIVANKKTMFFNLKNVLALSFSPGRRYLTAIEKREDNKFYLSIFEADPLRKLYEMETSRYKKETWPQIKFTQNDELAFWASTPTNIEVLNPRNHFHNVQTLKTKEFDFFDISEKMENLMIVCVSLEKSAGYYGHEGRIDVFKYQNFAVDSTPFVSKLIDKAHEVNLFFSPTGQNVLVWAQTFTDKTGQSYYGEHILLYLDVNEKTFKRVPTYKGPIHDIAWNPNGSEFIAISGFMPAGSVLYDKNSVPKFEFGQHHKNTIKWSPLCRFVCLAGFGNLPGDMEIWDVVELKQVGTCKSGSAVTCRWAPDGRKIMTGILNPRLRVSNNYKIFKYNGELLQHVDFSSTELYEVIWRPAKFIDRPASPVKVRKTENSEENPDSAEEKPKEGEKKLFRPKGAGSFAAQLKAERSAKSGGRHLQPDETFGNDPNKQNGEEQKAQDEKDGKKEEEQQQPPAKPVTKIMRRNEKMIEEENRLLQEKLEKEQAEQKEREQMEPNNGKEHHHRKEKKEKKGRGEPRDGKAYDEKKHEGKKEPQQPQ